MKRFILLLVCSVLFAQDLQLKQIVISSGAVQSERLKGTVGQPVIGATTTDNYILSAGFWGSVSRMFLDVDDEVSYLRNIQYLMPIPIHLIRSQI